MAFRGGVCQYRTPGIFDVENGGTWDYSILPIVEVKPELSEKEILKNW